MTIVSDESQKLGLSFGLITTLLVLCAMCRKLVCRNRNYSNDIEYNNMAGTESKRKYITFFGMLYLMSVLHFLTEVIFDVANNRD